MKKLCTLLLLLALAVSVAVACRDGREGDETSAQTDAPTSDSVTTGAETTKEPETEAPETLTADDGTVITDDALYGWFDYGSALYRRDDFAVADRDAFSISMAKNEKEGFQYLLASTKNYDDLRCEVSVLTDANGNTLEGEVYVAQNIFVRKASPYNYSRGFVPFTLLSQDNPYLGGTFDVIAGRSKTLYVQYSTDANTAPGTYTGRLEIKRGDEVILAGEVSVTVWDLYYEEEPAAKLLFGWGYDASDDGQLPGPANAPDFNADPSWYDVYMDFMLDNRLSPNTYRGEGGLLNENAAEFMDNPRVSLASITDQSNLALQYEKAEEMGWLDKIVFHQFDEPHEDWHIDYIIQGIVMVKRVFPTTQHLNAFYMDLPKDGLNIADRLGQYSTVHCAWTPAYAEGDPIGESLYKLKEERGDTLIWYTCGANPFDTIDLNVFFPGTLKRTLFWQQYLYDVDGYLYWSTTWWFSEDDIWEEGYEEKKHKLPSSTDDPTANGVLIYFDPITKEPVATLGMESVRDGIEDYQLFAMAEEALGRDTVLTYIKRITTSLTEFNTEAEVLMQVRNELAAALLAANAQ